MAERLTIDTMAWIREIRDRMYEETRSMTADERIAYIRRNAEEAEQLVRSRRAAHDKQAAPHSASAD